MNTCLSTRNPSLQYCNIGKMWPFFLSDAILDGETLSTYQSITLFSIGILIREPIQSDAFLDELFPHLPLKKGDPC